jgi:hypothetical protein
MIRLIGWANEKFLNRIISSVPNIYMEGCIGFTGRPYDSYICNRHIGSVYDIKNLGSRLIEGSSYTIVCKGKSLGIQGAD